MSNYFLLWNTSGFLLTKNWDEICPTVLENRYENSRIANFYTKSFALIRESFALIRESFGLIRESYTFIRKIFALIRESFA